ncbi:hypothetical protein B0H16DRAFT_1471535 [Mycena metata]|uniref:Uncharacterized protein n=1 Tax=Mycena metata TaxID=1033252 RepID=A0AAD7HQU4_9AGAR|nr:hypothetical protein B0H16DRAFT_1471535 [Mycena metata]
MSLGNLSRLASIPLVTLVDIHAHFFFGTNTRPQNFRKFSNLSRVTNALWLKNLHSSTAVESEIAAAQPHRIFAALPVFWSRNIHPLTAVPEGNPAIPRVMANRSRDRLNPTRPGGKPSAI